MSLRLNKAIGYALTDLTPDDPRINQDSPLLNWTRFEEEDENFTAPDFEGYIAWLQKAAEAGTGGFGTRMEATLLTNAIAREHGRTRLIDAVIHRDESNPETLVLIPPIYLGSWNRNDDTIDYVESRLMDGNGLENTVTPFSKGFGAYSSRFMDLDGTDLGSPAVEFLHLAEAGMPDDELDRIAREITPLAWTDQRQLYSTAAEAFSRIVPTVPSDIRRLAEYGQLFNSGDVWKQLRPVLYTYWS